MNAIVNAYLTDLERALASAEPGERAEIVIGVKEHIEERLAEIDGDPTDEQIHEVLESVGSVDEVVASWERPDRAGTPVFTPWGPPPAPTPPKPYSWIPWASLGITLISPWLVFINPYFALAVLIANVAATIVLAMRLRNRTRGWPWALALIPTVFAAMFGVMLAGLVAFRSGESTQGVDEGPVTTVTSMEVSSS